jgi:hypothetical protein
VWMESGEEEAVSDMAKKNRSFREWVIYIDGVGTLTGTNSSMRSTVALMKQQRWPDNDCYQVRRVRITLDPEKRTKKRT